MSEEKIFIGSDHAGFDTKEIIIKYLEKNKINYHDFTPIKLEKDDYPDYAFKVAENVSKNKKAKGILICGTGTGMVMAANKVKGARAVAPYDLYTSKMSRQDNDANIICLRGRSFPPAKAIKLLDLWLKTNFSNNPRHKRRLGKISKYERS